MLVLIFKVTFFVYLQHGLPGLLPKYKNQVQNLDLTKHILWYFI